VKNRNLCVWGVAAMLATVGCSTVAGGGARPTYVRDAMENYRFPKACDALWGNALAVIAAKGYGLAGTDRQLAGQDRQGAIPGFLNPGHATTRDDRRAYESVSDANDKDQRYMVQGRPAGTDGCYVQYFSILDDLINSVGRSYRDYDMELALLSRVDPAAAARIAQGEDKAK